MSSTTVLRRCPWPLPSIDLKKKLVNLGCVWVEGIFGRKVKRWFWALCAVMRKGMDSDLNRDLLYLLLGNNCETVASPGINPVRGRVYGRRTLSATDVERHCAVCGSVDHCDVIAKGIGHVDLVGDGINMNLKG